MVMTTVVVFVAVKFQFHSGWIDRDWESEKTTTKISTKCTKMATNTTYVVGFMCVCVLHFVALRIGCDFSPEAKCDSGMGCKYWVQEWKGGTMEGHHDSKQINSTYRVCWQTCIHYTSILWQIFIQLAVRFSSTPINGATTSIQKNVVFKSHIIFR